MSFIRTLLLLVSRSPVVLIDMEICIILLRYPILADVPAYSHTPYHWNEKGGERLPFRVPLPPHCYKPWYTMSYQVGARNGHCMGRKHSTSSFVPSWVMALLHLLEPNPRTEWLLIQQYLIGRAKNDAIWRVSRRKLNVHMRHCSKMMNEWYHIPKTLSKNPGTGPRVVYQRTMRGEGSKRRITEDLVCSTWSSVACHSQDSFLRSLIMFIRREIGTKSVRLSYRYY